MTLIILFVIAAVVVIAIYASAKPGLAPTPNAVRSFYTKIHGVTFKNTDGEKRQNIIDRCRIGEDLNLIPEPTNKHDADAVKICRKDGECLGYWTGDGRMAGQLSRGAKFRVRISRIYPLRNDESRHGVALFVEKLD
jgi:hypothetical protein